MTEKLWTRSARELAGLIANREVTATEVLEAHLDRVAEVNGALNAVVRILEAEARTGAAEADRAVAAGEPLGPLHGVPISVKDNIDVVGDVSTQGIPLLAETPATADAPAVARMRAAGAIPFVRTNMPELGLRVHTHSATYGLTLNPWDSEVTVAGSSGGEASAIAAGMSPLGLGNDIGGSLRNPAYACGIASIKASTQRVPYATTTMPGTSLMAEQLMLAQGVLARRVADVRQGFEVLAGTDPRDPYCIAAPFDGPTTPRRAALVPDPDGGSTDPRISAAVQAAGSILEAAGWQVDEIQPPRLEEAYLAWTMLMTGDLAHMRPALELALTPESLSFLDAGGELIPAPTPESIHATHQLRLEIAVAWATFMEQYPVIIGPTWTQQPFSHGFDITSPETSMEVLEMMRFVLPQNLLGIPAVCVPSGIADGLPTGVQITGRRFREDDCLAVGALLEDAFGILTPIDPR
jgi:amidase